MASNVVRVLVWDENPSHAPKEVYPNNIRGAVAQGLIELGKGEIEATPIHLDEPNQGITQVRLKNADVLIWWGHARHVEVKDEVAQMVKKAVHEDGLGFIALHSAHYSKPFRAVLGATGHLKGGWRENTPADTEEITVCAPKHPIAEGVSDFTLPAEEMYGAPFDVPPYQVLVFQSYFPLGGEYFPSFATTVGKGIDPEFTSGHGKGQNQGEGAGRVFYFRPGHETFPTYFDKNVRRVIYNGVLWCSRRK
jgi:trehalose utilization protein